MASQEWWEQFRGETIDRTYFLDTLIGIGAFGGVFRAEHRVGGQFLRSVAIKLLLPDSTLQDQQFVELQSQITTQHPHLLSCFHAGHATLRSSPFLFLVMELADSSLDRTLKDGLLPSQEVVRLATHMSAALQHLHQHRMVHRDIKPANILRVGEAWKIADFGLVRSTGDRSHARSSQVAGTLSYMPPESFEGIVSPGWDVWSFGVLLQEALTGIRPYRAESDGQLIAAIVSQPPHIPATLAPPFDRVIAGCLERDRSRRWNIDRVAAALQPQVAHVHGSVPLHLGKIAEPLEGETVSSGDFWRAYRRIDPETGEAIVLKTLPDSGETRYLLQEYAALSRLDHPHITRLRSFDPTPKRMRAVLNSVVGDVTLLQVLAGKLFPVVHAASLFVPIFEALDHMHGRGVVHGLLRPQQVLLATHRLGYHPVLHGFALSSVDGDRAPALQRTMPLADHAYAAPEQLDSRNLLSPAADIYSTGQMLGELIRGAPYYSVDEFAHTLYQKIQLKEPLSVDDSPWSVNSAIEAIVRECTAIDPAQRPSAREVSTRLKRLLPASLASAVAYPWNLTFRSEPDGELPGWTNGVGIVGDAVRGYRLGNSTDGTERALYLEAGPEVLPTQFGTLTQRSMLHGCSALPIRLTGRLKTEGVTGRAAIWIRGDTASGGELFLENMASQAVIGNNDWREYSVEAELIKPLVWLNFGLFLSGRGRLYASGLRLDVRTAQGWRTIGW